MHRNDPVRLLATVVALAGSVALLASCTDSRSPDSGVQALVERLQVLEDQDTIRDMLQHYIELNESKDWRAYSLLFASDGELVMRSGTLQGPDAIHTEMEKNYGKDKISPDSILNRSSHLLTNIRVSVIGDTAKATSRWTLLVPGEKDAPRVAQAGKYSDQLVRVSGEWKFKQRVITPDMPSSR
jgi:hypothetical protein